MSSLVSYYPGGVIAGAPQQNRAEQWDTTTGYTSWDAAGNQTTQRALTSAEAAMLAAQDAAVSAGNNQASLTAKASTALTNNAAYLALGAPTTAQAVAQVAALTRQMDAVIRLVIGQLDATTGS